MDVKLITDAALSKFFEKTFDNLFSRLGDIFRGDKNKKKQLSNLKVKLLAVEVVADDAEQKQFTDPRVRDWLLAAKVTLFDAEDLLEEIDHALSKTQVEAQSQSAAKKVWNSLKSSFVSFFENKIESRLEKLIEDLEDLETRSHVLGLKRAGVVVVGSGSGSKLRPTTYLPNESVIYGRDEDKELVFKWLTSETHNNLSILSIVGMGGMGKTTLAQHVFNDPRTDEAKFDVKAWVCVSDEFDVFKVSRAILEDVTGSPDDSTNTMMVHKRLTEKLKGKKFLVVLDDVWNKSKSEWEEVQKPLNYGAKGSRILVTTRERDVADTMRSDTTIFLEVLQRDDCWKLFAKHAFREDDAQPNRDCREIGKEIVKKCKGLPLALKTMGSLLYNKSVSEWERVFQSEIWELPKERSDIIPALALSYILLPSHLKVCFAYCALFPKDYEFEKEHLMHLWMVDNRLNCPSERYCQEYFNDLLSRSFFQQSGKYEEMFLMHDLLNDLAKYVGGGIYFRWEVGQTEKIQKLTRHFSAELGFCQNFEEFETLRKTKRLRAFMPTGRSLNYFPHWDINMWIRDFFSEFKFLRVLSLSINNLKELPDSVGNLEHLCSLDLSFTTIKKLPENICSLSHLQILKLNNCSDLEELPTNLHLLGNLCRLEFIGTKVRKLPPHLEKLKNLTVMMTSFNVGNGGELGIQRLGEFKLEGRLLIKELQNIENSQDALKADLKNKTRLVTLDLSWERNGISVDSEKEEDVIEKLEPSRNLKSLSITNYGGKQFPNWLLENSLRNMVSLKLYKCQSCQRLPSLGLLPLLKDLKIAELDGIVSIDADFHGNNSSSFKSLETLEFSSMKEWEKWECTAMTGAFPRLEELSIIYCPKLKGELPKINVPLEGLYISHCQQLDACAPKALNLELEDCGKLVLDGATVRTLRMKASWLNIDGYPKLVGSLKRVFGDYSCLNNLHIENLDAECFPDKGLLPLSLTSLSIHDFRNLKMLNYKGLYQLSSLKRLTLVNCPILRCLPEEGLPKSISHLSIMGCPDLEERCKEGGEDWRKIADIQHLEIDITWHW